MNLKRAIALGAFLWVLIFFEISILMFGFNLTKNSQIYPFHYTIALILIALCSISYFKKDKASLSKGIYLGIIFVIVGLLLDAIITVPLFVKNYNFFLSPWLLLGLAETIIVCAIVALFKSKSR